jgi:hypothetical protein
MWNSQRRWWSARRAHRLERDRLQTIDPSYDCIFLEPYLKGLYEKIVDHLHKFGEFAAVDIMRGTENLDGAA